MPTQKERPLIGTEEPLEKVLLTICIIFRSFTQLACSENFDNHQSALLRSSFPEGYETKCNVLWGHLVYCILKPYNPTTQKIFIINFYSYGILTFRQTISLFDKFCLRGA